MPSMCMCVCLRVHVCALVLFALCQMPTIPINLVNMLSCERTFQPSCESEDGRVAHFFLLPGSPAHLQPFAYGFITCPPAFLCLWPHHLPTCIPLPLASPPLSLPASLCLWPHHLPACIPLPLASHAQLHTICAVAHVVEARQAVDDHVNQLAKFDGERGNNYHQLLEEVVRIDPPVDPDLDVIGGCIVATSRSVVASLCSC